MTAPLDCYARVRPERMRFVDVTTGPSTRARAIQVQIDRATGWRVAWWRIKRSRGARIVLWLALGLLVSGFAAGVGPFRGWPW